MVTATEGQPEADHVNQLQAGIETGTQAPLMCLEYAVAAADQIESACHVVTCHADPGDDQTAAADTVNQHWLRQNTAQKSQTLCLVLL